MDPLERTLLAAQGYFELEMPAEALRQLDSLPPAAQMRADGLELRVVILMMAERWREAARACERLCAVAPEVPGGFIHHAFCLHELGKTGQAREVLLDGPPALVKEATYHYNLACYECVLGNLESARAHLAMSLKMDAGLREHARTDPDLRPLGDLHEA